MTKRVDTIQFKTVSPLFEMERDGIKPFTVRKYDSKDGRFRILSRWPAYSNNKPPLYLEITNPQTGESFTRRLTSRRYLPSGALGWDTWRQLDPAWLILYWNPKEGGYDQQRDISYTRTNII